MDEKEEVIIEGWIVYEIIYRSGCREIRIRNYLDGMIEEQNPMYVKVVKIKQPEE